MTLCRRLISLILPLLMVITAPIDAAELSVFAASSLSDALRELSRRYQAEHPKEQILLNFAGSQTLATQIALGAPADLFISANQTVMERLKNQDLVERPQPLLHNRLAVALRSDLKPQLTTLEELARPNLLLAVGNQRVPIGHYTQQLFSKLSADAEYGSALMKKIGGNIVSQENRVKAIVAKLLLGEADAGIVYQSDLACGNAKQLARIPLPKKYNPTATYPLAKVRGAKTGVDPFVEYLFSAAGQAVFRQYGFIPRGSE